MAWPAIIAAIIGAAGSQAGKKGTKPEDRANAMMQMATPSAMIPGAMDAFKSMSGAMGGGAPGSPTGPTIGGGINALAGSAPEGAVDFSTQAPPQTGGGGMGDAASGIGGLIAKLSESQAPPQASRGEMMSMLSNNMGGPKGMMGMLSQIRSPRQPLPAIPGAMPQSPAQNPFDVSRAQQRRKRRQLRNLGFNLGG